MADQVRHLVDAQAAAEAAGVPVGTIYGWKSKKKLVPVQVLPDGTALYDAREVLVLAAATHRRPNRRQRRADADS